MASHTAARVIVGDLAADAGLIMVIGIPATAHIVGLTVSGMYGNEGYEEERMIKTITVEQSLPRDIVQY
jgi:hypothetical protein